MGHAITDPAARTLPRPVRGVIFDLDGTLLDTEGHYRLAFEAAMAECGHALPGQDYDRLVGLPSPARRLRLPSLLGAAFPVDAFFAAYYRHRTRALAGAIPLKPGAVQALDLLDAVGTPRAVATSASTATATSHLAASGLAWRIGALITRDHVTHGKPAPDSFLAAAAALGLEPQDCLAIEDSLHGVHAAWSAGLMTVMVPDRLPPTPACRANCLAILNSLHDLWRLLGVTARETTPA
jgi:HAD superfamily hydrolase (TIGR01509 family)